ncbi:uncharacterized protein LOC131596753 [Vicia villosa]|uniref:uncharacterized protein LOC131596753 n=1 Tax=Vicia villosa TaxID=3911 RepID=UPI00273CCB1D|nr:uncharacterized protein LOC131596753 [Vicia villosa]
MDPNHFHYQQAMFNFMQNYQNPNPQNSQIPPMPPFSTQVPPFFTQVGTEKEERVVVKKKSREHFTRDKDILLIQSCLNVSKDPIVGVDQKTESFWVRVAANYNEYRGQSREKLKEQLKCRLHRINSLVQKFVGCYKQAVNGKKSGTSENDIMAVANAFFAQDQGTTFNLEYAWRLLKDEPKWMGESIGSSSKITKTYASEASSENPDTPSSYEFNSSSSMERPMGQKAAKRKGKESHVAFQVFAWKGQFCRGDHGKPTIMLEAVASQDLWIWHVFFGIAGSNNDINVLNQSNVFNDILEGHAPNGEKKKLFAQHQESARKDVERAFGVLQSRFAIIHGPARAWHMDTLKHTIYACIILHNMIVEDERHTYGGNFDYSYDKVDDNNSTTETFSGPHPNLATRLQRRASIREKQVHRQLQGDLVEYIWECFRHVDDEI